MRQLDNRAWLLMIPTILIMLFVGILPVMPEFNYSFLDISRWLRFTGRGQTGIARS